MATQLNVLCVKCLYLRLNMDLRLKKWLTYGLLMMPKVTRPALCVKDTNNLQNQQMAKSGIIFSLLLVIIIIILINNFIPQ